MEIIIINKVSEIKLTIKKSFGRWERGVDTILIKAKLHKYYTACVEKKKLK